MSYAYIRFLLLGIQLHLAGEQGIDGVGKALGGGVQRRVGGQLADADFLPPERVFPLYQGPLRGPF